MMEKLNPTARRDLFGSKINRDHSPAFVYGVPWLSIILASLVPMLPVLAPAPVVPPLSFMFLLGWRLLRPGLLPLWAGFPLGLIDDLLSGQPLGSSVLLFSLTLIALDLFELRFPWRGFWQDWIVASVLITLFLLFSAMLSGAKLDLLHFWLLAPQLLLSVLLFPIIVGAVTVLDRLRLLRVRRID